MKFFRKLREQVAENQAAEQNSQALLDELDRTEPQVDELHEIAVERLNESVQQAKRLKDADRRNHYSESLTYAMRGRMA